MDMVLATTITGPFADPELNAKLLAGIQNSMQELTEQGEQMLGTLLRPRPAGVYLSVAEAKPGRASTGNYRRNISGSVSQLRAVISDGGVVYGPWLEGVGSRNQSTRFKGYFSFRRTASYLSGIAAQTIEKNLTKVFNK